MTARAAHHQPRHHLDEALLLDYAAGAAPEGAALLIASHLALCPDCRALATRLESLGGALMSDLPPSDLMPGARDAMMARLDEAPRQTPIRGSGTAAATAAPQLTPAIDLPQPIRDYLAAAASDLSWRRLGPGVDHIELPLTGKGRVKESLRLLRVHSGYAIPRHTHDGSEMVLVLSGGFRDGAQDFLPGDVSVCDEHVDHSPRVPDEDCICLWVTDAPLRFTGFVGRILNLFVRL